MVAKKILTRKFCAYYFNGNFSYFDLEIQYKKKSEWLYFIWQD